MGAVANNNYGFKGTVSSAQTPLVLGNGTLYSVGTKDDLKVTAGGDGARAVTVGVPAGKTASAWGDGVLSQWTSGVTLNCAANATGSTRYDTVVIRRTWTPAGTPTGTATLMILTGGSSRSISSGRLTARGTGSSDQPIALVPVAHGAGVVSSVIDLRVWSGEGGGLVAEDVAALQYLSSKGTTVRIGDTVRTRLEDASGTLYWGVSGRVMSEPPYIRVTRNDPFSGAPINTGSSQNFYAGQTATFLGDGAAAFSFSHGATTQAGSVATPARIVFTEPGLYALGARLDVDVAVGASVTFNLNAPATDGTASMVTRSFVPNSIQTQLALSDTRFIGAGRSWTPRFNCSQPVAVKSWSMWATRIG